MNARRANLSPDGDQKFWQKKNPGQRLSALAERRYDAETQPQWFFESASGIYHRAFIIGRMTAVGCTMEDKGKAPEDSGQAQTGIFARIKSIATQNSFVTSAVTQLTRAERERAEVAEAERDRAIASAARLRYERDETRTIACFFLAAIIFSGSLSQWMTWICTIVAASGAMRLFIDLDIIRSWCKAIPSPGAPGASPSESAGLGSECVMPEEGCE